MEAEIHNLEQIAYGAVLRAFKAQSDALSWEKEGLITELRKELRVSDDEHRELLTEVNADDLIRRIREWRESGGSHNLGPNMPQHVGSQLPSPSVSASRKRQRVPLPGIPFGTQTQPGIGIQQSLTLSGKWGPTSAAGRRPISGPATSIVGKPTQYPFSDHLTSGSLTNEASESVQDSLIGRRVMIKWHEDNNFYEALITDYNASDGRYALVYDSNTPNATLEWVNFKEFHPDDVHWVGEDPAACRVGGLNHVRGRALSANQLGNDVRSAHDAVRSDDCEEIEILNTDILIKKVQKLLDASPPDLSEISKAKKMLKEHEQTLIEVIKKLANVTAIQDKQRSQVHGNSVATQLNVDYHGPSPEVQITDNAGSEEFPRR